MIFEKDIMCDKMTVIDRQHRRNVVAIKATKLEFLMNFGGQQ